MGVALGDIDNDLRPDIFATNFAQDHNTLYHNQGNGFFSDISGQAGLAGSSRPFMGWGTFFSTMTTMAGRISSSPMAT